MGDVRHVRFINLRLDTCDFNKCMTFMMMYCATTAGDCSALGCSAFRAPLYSNHLVPGIGNTPTYSGATCIKLPWMVLVQFGTMNHNVMFHFAFSPWLWTVKHGCTHLLYYSMSWQTTSLSHAWPALIFCRGPQGKSVSIQISPMRNCKCHLPLGQIGA